nr:hypothetical protein [Acidovorax sp. SUPP3434]
MPVLQGIHALAPVVRIYPAAQLAPFCSLVCMMSIVLSAMRAIPCDERVSKRFEYLLAVIVVISLIVMVLIPVTSIAQRFFMPSLGYASCSELQGNPTLWFSDWVRDPAWCVKGKSLDWVNEQARTAAAPHSTP